MNRKSLVRGLIVLPVLLFEIVGYGDNQKNHEDAISNRENKAVVSAAPDADDQTNEMLLDTSRTLYGGYGCFPVALTQFANKVAVTSGVRGGWIINEKYVIGIDIFYQNYVKPFSGSDDPLKSNLKLEYQQIGLLLEYISKPARLFHPVYSLVVGLGWAEFAALDNQIDRQARPDLQGDARYLAIEPQASYEMNVTKYFHIALGAGYRLAFETNNHAFQLKQSDFISPSIFMHFKVGNFRY